MSSDAACTQPRVRSWDSVMHACSPTLNCTCTCNLVSSHTHAHTWHTLSPPLLTKSGPHEILYVKLSATGAPWGEYVKTIIKERHHSPECWWVDQCHLHPPWAWDGVVFLRWWPTTTMQLVDSRHKGNLRSSKARGKGLRTLIWAPASAGL